MNNHVHLLMTPGTVEAAGALMERRGQRYVVYVNRTCRRSGTLWESRFRSCLTQEEDYVLFCYRYIELDPVRVGMVNHPAECPWSSYRVNAQGETSRVLMEHPLYKSQGTDEVERHSVYHELFRYELDPGVIDEIRSATNGNYVLGNSRFQAQIAMALGRRVVLGKSGRPRRRDELASGDLVW